LRFVESSGEAGQSTSLMFSFDLAINDPVVLGMYLGTVYTRDFLDLLKSIGRICLFPEVR
jgi:hypothetical protein